MNKGAHALRAQDRLARVGCQRLSPRRKQETFLAARAPSMVIGGAASGICSSDDGHRQDPERALGFECKLVSGSVKDSSDRLPTETSIFSQT